MMELGIVDSALSANRALATLDWVVSHPGQSFSLSELSRALDINIPSLMSVLKSLTDRGYLVRRVENKSYEAGPALIAVGIITSARHPSFERLSEELRALAQDVGTECFATVAIGDQSIVVSEAGRPSSYSSAVWVGLRFPIMAPNGHAFVAWSDPAEIEHWITSAENADIHIDRDRIAQELATVRQLGYASIEYRKVDFEPAAALERLGKKPGDRGSQEAVKTAMAEFTRHLRFVEPKAGETYESLHVTAPVFAADGRVLMAIVINGLPHVPGERLLACIERLLQTTRLLTKQAGGMVPGGR